MSLELIKINFQTAQAQAQKLESIADSIKGLSSRQMASTIQEMSACWKGESAAAYLSKAEQVQQNISKTSEELYKAAAAIREQAKRIYDAEMQSITLAQTQST